MKIKQHKAPKDLREKIDAKIHLLEGLKDLGELFFKNNPKAIIDAMSNKKNNKK